MADLSLATASYTTFNPSMGIAVRTSVGAPRFKLSYPIADVALELAPHPSWLKLPREKYEPLYRAKLEAVGVNGVLAAADRAQQKAGQLRTVVLLCFCDLTKPGAWCHRRLLAEWCEPLRLHIPEIGHPARPHQLTLEA